MSRSVINEKINWECCVSRIYWFYTRQDWCKSKQYDKCSFNRSDKFKCQSTQIYRQSTWLSNLRFTATTYEFFEHQLDSLKVYKGTVRYLSVKALYSTTHCLSWVSTTLIQHNLHALDPGEHTVTCIGVLAVPAPLIHFLLITTFNSVVKWFALVQKLLQLQ